MADKKSTVLLTGASGFLGKEIYHCFSTKFNFNVKTIGRNDDSDYYYDLLNSNISFKERFNLVVHSAGKAHSIPKDAKEEKEFYDINVQGTVNLLVALEKSGLPDKFVFISTVSVYGVDDGLMINENQVILAKTPYGISKYQAENLILNWCEKNNVLCTILRLPLIIGNNAPGNLGAMIKGIKKGYYFNIAGGLAKKSMVLLKDVAIVIPNVSEIGGIYNLTDGYHPSFYELSTFIAKQLGKSKVLNIPFVLAKMAAICGDFLGEKFPLNSNKLDKINSSLTFDDAKAKKSFAWNPTRVLDGFKLNNNVE
jgi:nucleoside-diphosphate-sugar epimerase